MLPNSALRGWHLDQMRKSLQIVRSLIQTHSETELTTFRDNGTGWTTLEVLCHLHDYEAACVERADITLNQDSAPLPNFNADEIAAKGRYNEQHIEDVYAEWNTQRTEFLTHLESLDEASWQRTAIHSKRGSMSLQDQLALIAWHDVNHIEQMTRVLAEKKA